MTQALPSAKAVACPAFFATRAVAGWRDAKYRPKMPAQMQATAPICMDDRRSPISGQLASATSRGALPRINE
ncbi:hypothetical protein D3C87_2066710 [compost metagenome]